MLKDIKQLNEIDGIAISRERSIENYIEIDEENNTIKFKMQYGPVQEYGVNGCEIECLIETARLLIKEADKYRHCEYNIKAVQALLEALYCLDARNEAREMNGEFPEQSIFDDGHANLHECSEHLHECG